MSHFGDDTPAARTRNGVLLAVLAAASFGTSGALASGLLTTGWTPITIVIIRLSLGALCLLPFALRDLRGRWSCLRRDWRLIISYGFLGMALSQVGYFSAVQRMAVGPSLLIEYTAPAVIVVWLWVFRGERPTWLTVTGACVVAAGLVLVLGLISGTTLTAAGVCWALVAMVGAAGYYLLAGTTSETPGTALSVGALIFGVLLLLAVGATGILPLHAEAVSARYSSTPVPWWLPLLGLGVISSGVAYSAGLAATRRLGSRLGSFVGLLEVVAGVAFAWLLLAQVPTAMQFLGGALVLAGIVVVKLGERPAPADEAEDLEREETRSAVPV